MQRQLHSQTKKIHWVTKLFLVLFVAAFLGALSPVCERIYCSALYEHLFSLIKSGDLKENRLGEIKLPFYASPFVYNATAFEMQSGSSILVFFPTSILKSDIRGYVLSNRSVRLSRWVLSQYDSSLIQLRIVKDGRIQQYKYIIKRCARSTACYVSTGAQA